MFMAMAAFVLSSTWSKYGHPSPILFEAFLPGELMGPKSLQSISLEPDILHGMHHVAPPVIDAALRHMHFQPVPRIEGQAFAELLLRGGGEGLRINIDGRDLLPRRFYLAPRDQRVFDRLAGWI